MPLSKHVPEDEHDRLWNWRPSSPQAAFIAQIVIGPEYWVVLHRRSFSKDVLDVRIHHTFDVKRLLFAELENLLGLVCHVL